MYAQDDEATAQLDPSFHLALSVAEWVRMTTMGEAIPTAIMPDSLSRASIFEVLRMDPRYPPAGMTELKSGEDRRERSIQE